MHNWYTVFNFLIFAQHAVNTHEMEMFYVRFLQSLFFMNRISFSACDTKSIRWHLLKRENISLSWFYDYVHLQHRSIEQGVISIFRLILNMCHNHCWITVKCKFICHQNELYECTVGIITLLTFFYRLPIWKSICMSSNNNLYYKKSTCVYDHQCWVF